MNYTKLIKLMYIIEREAISRWGLPVIYDDYYSLNCGPILSNTLDNITGNSYYRQPSADWERYIIPDGRFNVRLETERKVGKLNRAEVKLIDEIYERFGGMTWEDLIDWTHDQKNVPEWENPKGSRLPIEIKTILMQSGFQEDEINEILEEIEVSQSARELLAV
ncbi:Panacea domain-containing protein [Chroococcus sp. FPU101]|uniref:Panacea domain-containing protein n=1 Tax=Chroococcus sp. FPU101 TaxID=1974212 RepID=UPI001A8CFD15|nr:Panacea domain-containing protein [Chroococcus sp. FPU101]GFE72321.1 hypothetical protein CFPU101_49310 [Chroococcus sp. FPU101]